MQSCWNALVDGCMKVGDVHEGLRSCVGAMPGRNVVSWTAMITGYSQNGVVDRTLVLFDQECEQCCYA